MQKVAHTKSKYPSSPIPFSCLCASWHHRTLLLYLLRQTSSESERLIMPGGETEMGWALIASGCIWKSAVQGSSIDHNPFHNKSSSAPANNNSRPSLSTQCQCWCQLWISYVKSEVYIFSIINTFLYPILICWDKSRKLFLGWFLIRDRMMNR